MNKSVIIILLITSVYSASAQNFVNEQSEVIFFSKAAIEGIKAYNKNSMPTVDLSNPRVAFQCP